jgi:hypothetical protein
MRMQSRPMRALAAVLGAWIIVRLLVLFPIGVAATSPEPVPLTKVNVANPAVADASLKNRIASLLVPTQQLRADIVSWSIPIRTQRQPKIAKPRLKRLDATPMPQLQPSSARAELLAMQAAAPGIALPHATPTNRASNPDRPRLSGSAWAIVRSGGGRDALASGGQLGGSQAGARLYFAPGGGSLALTALASAPLAQDKGKYGAVGLALRGRAVGIIVEHRVAFDDGARSAVAVTGYGGLYDVKLAVGLKLDGYVQGGTVGGEGFVDGAVRVERTVFEHRRSRVSVGGGAWGGAQADAARLDVGPQIVARVPAGNATMRISAEWRERVAGDAQPGSGLTISAGLDF